jgi:hypothetical protein
MKIVDSPISWDDLAFIAQDGFGNLVKAVVDVERSGVDDPAVRNKILELVGYLVRP